MVASPAGDSAVAAVAGGRKSLEVESYQVESERINFLGKKIKTRFNLSVSGSFAMPPCRWQ